jgi:two-component system chemotaxis sensor kinase CheA
VVWVDRQAVATSVLSETLGGGPATSSEGPIVVLADSSQRHAFKIDKLLGQRDVVLKGLSRLLPKVPAVAGASVEPDGSVLLVLDPPGLIARAQRSGQVQVASPTPRVVDGRQPHILVVDDALTVRELQRSILERAHFDVRVAADGVQALALLQDEPADLVLTDVEMPNMDGFALTEAIRSNTALTNIPILILSSRASDADRQRGLDAGADGYIVKSGFDEASLLSAVDRLLGSRR